MEEFVNVFINKEDSGVAPSSNQDFYGEWIDHGTSLANVLSFPTESVSLGQTQ